ncbi:MAG: TIGR02996 domain-containing protein [Planctomycetia bacterium]|nr:TIGR02996 domain-containing protein [Planctomycetia bacterium]
MDLLSQHEAFLRAIFDAPDDDTPRLVYADFLQENGEEDRAELIRVQCELAANMGSWNHSDRYYQLAAREEELLDYFYPERLEVEPHDRFSYERGFRFAGETFFVTAEALADLTAERWRIIRHEPELFHAEWLHVGPGVLLRPEHIDRLFSLPVVQRIAEWNLSGRVVEELTGGDPDTFNLIDLVQTPAITIAGVETLARHRGVRRIATLDLRNNNLDNDAARALMKSPYLDNLKRLELFEGNRFRGRVWQEVLERFGEDVVG